MNASQAEVIKKCRNDLQKERIVKSVLCGMAVGFSVMFIVAFITWIFEFKGLWLSIGLGVAVWIWVGWMFYSLVFKLTDMAVMQRIDRAGLDERMVTMYELQGDNSYMAQRQREDASSAFDAAVKKSGGRLIKIKISTAIICIASVVSGFALAMAVVTGLSDYGVIPTLGDLCSNGGLGLGGSYTTPTYTVTYKVGGVQDAGQVNNAASVVEKVKKGDTSSVRASVVDADSHYIAKWVDQNGVEYDAKSPVFVVSNVQKSMTYTAIFEAYDDPEERGFSYYYNPDGDDDNDDPPEDMDGDDSGQDTPDSGDNQPSPIPNPGSGGSPTTPGNTIIDGNMQYEENYDYWYQIAMDMMANGTDGYPPELVAMLEAYFGTL